MGDADEIAAVADAHPGASAIMLRDVLRGAGRVSITVADVERVLRKRPDPPRDPSETGEPGEAGEAGSSASGVVNPSDDPDDGPSPRRRGTVRAGLPPLYRWQSEALAAWEVQARQGVVEAVTGTGKTMVGIAATLDELDRGGQVCILVPTRELLRQWHDVIGAVVPMGHRVGLLGGGRRDSLGHCDILLAIVNSAAASATDLDLRPRRPGGLLVGDECHRYGSERNRLALVEHFPHRLGLSATFERADDGHLTWLEPFFGPTCFSMDYRRAIDDGVTASFTVAVVGVRLDENELADYHELSATMATGRAQLIGRYLVPADPIGAFLAAVAQLARRGGDEGAITARQYLWAMQERRHLLAETPAKRRALRGLIPALAAADRSIVFTQSIRAAEDAAATIREHGVAAAAIHSHLASPDRHETLHRFADGRIHVLAAPHVLDEGIDVPAADLAVILAGSRSRRQMVQRMGRVLRRKPDGRRARFVIVAAEDTVEDPRLGAHEDFLDTVLDVADAVEWFPSTAPPQVIVNFLEPNQSR